MILASTILKTVLAKYKDPLAQTICRRLETTSRPDGHIKMLKLLALNDYQGCIDLLETSAYGDQFKSAIFCMSQHAGTPNEDIEEVLDAWQLFVGEY